MLLIYEEKNIKIKVEQADNFLNRFFGLMGRKTLAKDEGLLLSPCSSIHTFCMKFTIDVVYLDNNNIVLDKETIRPWKVGKIVSKTKKVLELSEGMSNNINKGDLLYFR